MPVWVPGPCRNPKCKAYVEEAEQESQDKSGEAAVEGSGSEPPRDPAK